MNENPNYYAVIPANVRYAKIKANAKLLYGEITALANKKGYCYASTGYFAELYEVSEKQVKIWIGELENHDFITNIIVKEYGNKRFIFLGKVDKEAVKSKLTSNQKVTTSAPKGYDPSNQKVTTYNNTINNTSNIKKEKKFDAENYILNLDLDQDIKESLTDWIEVRKAKKTATTQKAIDLALNKLSKFSKETQKQMLENSVLNGWTGIFEIKEEKVKENKENIFVPKKIIYSETYEEYLEEVKYRVENYGSHSSDFTWRQKVNVDPSEQKKQFAKLKEDLLNKIKI